MNRSTALLLAVSAFLAHLLMVHQDVAGRLGPAFDDAHVAFRIGRLLVHGPTGGAAVEATEVYPSPAWIALAAFAERLRWPPTTTAQVVALISALAAVWVVSRFSPARLAGVIAPMLCVVSGSIAAAAGGGSEWVSFALCATTAFLAFEHGRPVLLAAALIAASLVRPEGALLTAAFVVLRISLRFTPGPAGGRRIGVAAFLAPLAVEVVLALMRRAAEGTFVAPTIAELVTPDAARVRAGVAWVGDFFLHSGAPLLAIVPLLLGLVGRLNGRAVRALALALAWAAYVALQGGSMLPFWAAMVPALPLLFLAVQEALIVLIDDGSLWPRRAAWTLFFAALLSSGLASKLPNDLGPVPLAGIHRAWLGDERRASDDPFDIPRARPGVRQVVRDTGRLRSLGVFLRDHVDPRATVTSPWPGAIGYLSRRTVADALGRSTPLPGAPRRSWFGPPRTDLVAVMETDADYIVPFIVSGEHVPRVVPFVSTWFERYDVIGPDPERMRRFWERLESYELIAVPVTTRASRSPREGVSPFFLLRHRRLGLRPSLHVAVADGAFTVDVAHAGHAQLVDLEVLLRDEAGEVRSLRPMGHFTPGRGVHARTDLWLSDTGERTVRLVRAELPPDFDAVTLSAVLRNPGSQADRDFSYVSDEVVVRLRR